MSLLPQRKRMKGVGRVAFMARLDDITADLEAGWPIKAVYQKCSDKLGMSYAQFARVRRPDRQAGQSPECRKPQANTASGNAVTRSGSAR